MRHIVALSGGKDSTAMAVVLREMEPQTNFEYVCTPTGDELPEMFEHWRNLGQILGKPIIPVVHHLGLNGLIAAQRALPNFQQRWCTRMLKIEPFARYLAAASPATSYVGLRADEEPDARQGGDYSAIPGIVMRFPLRELGWNIDDVWKYLRDRNIEIPARTDCGRCFFQRIYEWYNLWKDHPDIYADAERQEVEIGYTFRSPSRDTQPAALKDLRAKFEAGYIPKQRGVKDPMAEMKCRVCSM